MDKGINSVRNGLVYVAENVVGGIDVFIDIMKRNGNIDNNAVYVNVPNKPNVPWNVLDNKVIQENIVDPLKMMFSKLSGGGKGDRVDGDGTDDIPPAFKQKEFASTYESRFKQTPAETNIKVVFEGARGESLCTLKPPPDPTLQKILNEAGIEGIEYRNGVPDFSPVAKAQLEIDYMLGGKGTKGNAARDYNFKQANEKLAVQLNNSPELASKFGMESGGITAKDIEKYRVIN
ncbi:hypothetical protein J2S19_004488 [Metabacillus malikii]|uniref:Uncharacterized protein n=1 Tax=Metabacillus malikii TaxID=1504265 RepID=A0ABT9ZLK2_9BACI|nr:hypothetical protein [Metabacillus malikii]